MKSSYLTLPSIALIAITTSFSGCKDSTDEPSRSDNSKQELRVNPEREKARELILATETLEIITEKNGIFKLRNKHTGIEHELSTKDILDEKFKVLAAVDLKALQKLRDLPKPDWEKTPPWIYRYQDAEIQPGSMHFPLEDGSVSGSITILHSDPVAVVKTKLSEYYQSLNMTLSAEGTHNNSHILKFNFEQQDAEKRSVTLNIKREMDKTKISTQYSYGMP